MEVRQKARGTTAQNDGLTGAVGQITVDTDRDELRLHDGSTAGGHRILNKAQNDLLYHGIGTLAIDDISGLQDALDDKADLAHTHVAADITDLATVLADKLDADGTAVDSDALGGVAADNYLRSDVSDTMSGNFVATGTVHGYNGLFAGQDGGGDSHVQFYDDNSNTWRSIVWDDSANAFAAEENDGGYHKIGLVYDGSSTTETNYPIGYVALVSEGVSNPNINGSYTTRRNSTYHFSLSSGTALTGTWRARGRGFNNENTIMQRVA